MNSWGFFSETLMEKSKTETQSCQKKKRKKKEKKSKKCHKTLDIHTHTHTTHTHIHKVLAEANKHLWCYQVHIISLVSVHWSSSIHVNSKTAQTKTLFSYRLNSRRELWPFNRSQYSVPKKANTVVIPASLRPLWSLYRSKSLEQAWLCTAPCRVS